MDDPAIRNEIVLTPEQYERKLAALATRIRDTLKGASLIAVQEAENINVLRDLVARPELSDLRYGVSLLDSSDSRGIDVGLLHRTDQVTIHGARQVQGTSNLPDKDGQPGTKPLFAREPLVVDLTVADVTSGAAQPLTVIANHFMAKYGDKGGSTERWRKEQAAFVRNLAEQERAARPSQPVLVAGDLNDTDDSPTLDILTKNGSPLNDIGQQAIPAAERYTYNYKGISQAIDHLLVTDDLASRIQAAGVRHVHTDMPATAPDGSEAPTDHDLLYAEFGFPTAT